MSYPAPVWTSERKAQLFEAIRNGLSTAAAAERFEVSKNAVIGALDRAIKRGDFVPPPSQGQRHWRNEMKRPQKTVEEVREAMEDWRKIDAMPMPEPPPEHPVPKGCRWIFGEPGKGKAHHLAERKVDGISQQVQTPGPYSYCDESVTEPGGSWCAEHAAIVWNPAAKHQSLPRLPKELTALTLHI